MKLGGNNSKAANGNPHELRGELIRIDDGTGQELTFTLYKSAGAMLIVSDTGWERTGGPDQCLSKKPHFSGSHVSVPCTWHTT
jgi:hypothetical protein